VFDVSNPLINDLNHILDNSQDIWQELRGQRLFITGGTGFFGCWLLESFIWANEQFDLNASALVLTRNLDFFRSKAPHLTRNSAIQFQIGDVKNFEFPQGNFTFIIHAATEASAKLNAESPLLMFDTIIEGTKRTLEFAKFCKAKKFLLTSSGAVYGTQPSEMTHIPESYLGVPDIMCPDVAYAEGKRVAEMLCILYAQQEAIEIKIARCFAFVGPYLPLDTHFAIGNFIRDGLKGGPIIIKGDGTSYRSYLYAADLALWLWKILFKGKVAYPYNVGSDADLSIADLAEVAASVFTPKVEVIIMKKAISDQKVTRYVPSITRALSDLQLKPLISLRESIIRTCNYASFSG